MSTGLNLLQKLIAYVLFLSIVIQFIACQLTKRFTTEKQFKQFRLFSLAGFIGFLLALISSLVYKELPYRIPIFIWSGLFVIAEILERRYNLSKLFEE